jgi:mono/diheme cytochrome c family protein
MATLLAGAVIAGAGPAQGAVDLAREVAPVLRRACVACHGKERARGGLRLDEGAGLRAVVKPGNAALSEVRFSRVKGASY